MNKWKPGIVYPSGLAWGYSIISPCGGVVYSGRSFSSAGEAKRVMRNNVNRNNARQARRESS